MSIQVTTITNTQIQNLQSTNVQLNLRTGDVVPNSGRLWINGVHWFYTPGASQFNPNATVNIGVGYGSFSPSGNQVVDEILLKGLIDQPIVTAARALPVSGLIPTGNNQNAVYAFATAGGGAIGSGGGILTAVLDYTITVGA